MGSDIFNLAVKEKKVSLRRKFTLKKKYITGGSGILRFCKPGIKISFHRLLELMITKSDNTAANMVIRILGFDYVNSIFKRKLKLRKTVLRRLMMDFTKRRRGIENYICADDIRRVLEKIYAGKLINRRYSKMMLSFLKTQKINDRIPKLLPKVVTVAHKTGLERGVVHDAGIVFSPRGIFLICVLTYKVRNYRVAKNFIARISYLTYQVYNKPKKKKK